MSKVLTNPQYYSDIATAIRTKNGETTEYKPSEMASAIEAIETGSQEEVNTFVQQNEHVTAYLSATSSYTASNYSSVSVASDYKDTTQTTWDQPEGQTIESSSGTIYFTDEETGDGWHDTVSGTTYTVYNLVPDHWYTYVIRDTGGTIQNIGRIKGTGNTRMIYVPSLVRNFRDIGGWDADGGTVNYGTIYRGAQLSWSNSGTVYTLINADGINYLRDICGIRSEIDLRLDSQTINIESSPLGDDVEYLRYSYSDADYVAIVNPSGDYAAQTKELITHIMTNAIYGKGTYIHCAAGADRTGVICFILEAMLGMAAEDCDRDYELTTFYGGGAYDRLRTGTLWQALRAYFDSLDGDTLQDEIMTWCKKMRITDTLVNAYRHAMIDGDPTDIVITPDYYSISLSLTNSISSNAATEVESGVAYTTTITALTGYDMSTMTITMGGNNITASVYDSDTGVITIPSVTGDVVITAVAKEGKKDVLWSSTDASGNVIGVLNNYRLNSSGNAVAYSGSDASGFIAYSAGQTIEFENIKMQTSTSYSSGAVAEGHIHFYDATFTRLTPTNANMYMSKDMFRNGTCTYSDDNTYCLTYIPGNISGASYFRISTREGIPTDAKIYVY